MCAVRSARDIGALEVLAAADNACGQAAAFGGDFASAELFVAEVDAVKEATGTRIGPYAAIALAGLRGREAEASELIGRVITEATAGGQGTAVQYAHWANSCLMNGLGRYEEALTAAVDATEHTPQLFIASWALSELIEAATRTANEELAKGALARLGEHTEACDSDWGLGIHVRSRALLSEGEAAECLYREAVDRLARTRLRPELARAHLLYGEWLRREGRRVDAREQLRMAHDMLATIGMKAFAGAPVVNCLPRARRCARAATRRATSSPRRRRRSPDSPVKAFRTPRSAPAFTSALAPSNGTCAKCSPSSGSALARPQERPPEARPPNRARITPPVDLRATPVSEPGHPTEATDPSARDAPSDRREGGRFIGELSGVQVRCRAEGNSVSSADRTVAATRPRHSR